MLFVIVHFPLLFRLGASDWGGWRILLRNSPTHRRISFILRSKHEAWGSEWVKEQILQAFSPATEKMLWSEGGKSIFVCRGGGWLIRAEKLFSQSTSFHNSLLLQHAQRFSQKINYSIFFYDMRALIDNRLCHEILHQEWKYFRLVSGLMTCRNYWNV